MSVVYGVTMWCVPGVIPKPCEVSDCGSLMGVRVGVSAVVYGRDVWQNDNINNNENNMSIYMAVCGN